MNILQQQEALKDLSDQQIAQEMQQPSGQMPPFLVTTEAKRRADMRQRFQNEQAEPSQTTVQDDLAGLMSQGAAPQQPMGPGPQAGLPPQAPAQPPQAGGIMAVAPPQSAPGNVQRGFAEGGIIQGYADRGTVRRNALGSSSPRRSMEHMNRMIEANRRRYALQKAGKQLRLGYDRAAAERAGLPQAAMDSASNYEHGVVGSDPEGNQRPFSGPTLERTNLGGLSGSSTLRNLGDHYRGVTNVAPGPGVGRRDAIALGDTEGPDVRPSAASFLAPTSGGTDRDPSAIWDRTHPYMVQAQPMPADGAEFAPPAYGRPREPSPLGEGSMLSSFGATRDDFNIGAIPGRVLKGAQRVAKYVEGRPVSPAEHAARAAAGIVPSFNAENPQVAGYIPRPNPNLIDTGIASLPPAGAKTADEATPPVPGDKPPKTTEPIEKEDGTLKTAPEITPSEKSGETYDQLYKAQMEAIKAEDDPLASRKERIDAREAKLAMKERMNLWMSVAKAGLAIAAGQSPDAITNISAGLMGGMNAYEAGQKDINASRRDIDAARDAGDMARIQRASDRRKEAAGHAKTQMEIRSDEARLAQGDRRIDAQERIARLDRLSRSKTASLTDKNRLEIARITSGEAARRELSRKAKAEQSKFNKVRKAILDTETSATVAQLSEMRENFILDGGTAEYFDAFAAKLGKASAGKPYVPGDSRVTKRN
jgi:hypothetical protein